MSLHKLVADVATDGMLSICSMVALDFLFFQENDACCKFLLTN